MSDEQKRKKFIGFLEDVKENFNGSEIGLLDLQRKFPKEWAVFAEGELEGESDNVCLYCGEPTNSRSNVCISCEMINEESF